MNVAIVEDQLTYAVEELARELGIRDLSEDLLTYARTGKVTERLSKNLDAGSCECRQAVEILFQADVSALQSLRQ